MDYRDHKPDRNIFLVLLLSSGVGLRQSARFLGMNRKCVEAKARKIGRHCKDLNKNLRGKLPERVTLQFDEIETYETRRNTRPLTLPVLIDRETRFILGARSAPIRPNGTMTPSRLKAIERDRRRLGERPSRSRAAVRNVLRQGARCLLPGATIIVQTDEKSTYPGLARWALGQHIAHETVSSQIARTTWNKLFPINHTEACMRDLIGRLRRDSWLVSKRRWFLNLHLHIYMAVRNYAFPRFNRDKESPAQMLGWIKERLTIGQLLSWRQDHRALSGDPTSRNALPRAA
jgi:hypothetical protein